MWSWPRMASPYRRKIIILGKTGSGKSSLGNSLLATNAFEVGMSLNPVTELCQKRSENNICVVDTPGLLDVENPVAQTALEILSSLNICPKPHAFIIVFSALTRAGHDELRTISLLRLIFTENILNHVIVVFTGYDDEATDTDFDKFWRGNNKMRDFIEACGGRVARIDNKGSKVPMRVTEILNVVDILCENGQKRFDCTFKSVNEDVLRQLLTKHAMSAMNISKTQNSDNCKDPIETFDEQVKQIRIALSKKYYALFTSARLKEKLLIANVLFGVGCVAAGAIFVSKGKVTQSIAAATGVVSSAGMAAFIDSTLQTTKAILEAVAQSEFDTDLLNAHIDNLMKFSAI